MKDAIDDSGLEDSDISNEMTGIIVGSGGPSTQNLFKSSEIGKNSGSKKIGPFMVPRAMSSTNSATLATPFKIKGVNYSITSACSTSSHCIGNNQSDVIDSLKNLKSGITSAEEYEEFSFRSLVHGKPNIDINNEIDRRLLRFMGDRAAYNYIAM